MGLGLLLGRLIPGLGDALSAVQVDGVARPIAIGLLVMMYPVLAKVRYDRPRYRHPRSQIAVVRCFWCGSSAP